MTDPDAVLKEAVALLRRPVARDPKAFDAAVRAAMGAGRADPRRPLARLRKRLTGPRLVLSPLTATAWTVAVASVAVAAVLTVNALVSPGPRGMGAEAIEGVVRHQFVLVAPAARSVSLVGDFNDWAVGATPLVRQGDVWTVEVPLGDGRHAYSFVVDGEWVADATAPRAADADFGRPSSIVLVGVRGP